MIEISTRTIVAGIFAVILLTASLTSTHNVFAATSSTGIMVPLYSYPGSYWTQVIQAKNAHPSVPFVVIINPNNGPGSSIDSTYVSSVQQMQSAGIVVLGYVATGYGSNSQSSEESQINSYISWYHVNGIFFDEMANTSGLESYYSTLNNYAHNHGLTFTVGNPGTDTLSSYIGTMDNLVIYENPGLPTLSDLGSWHTSYSKSNFSMIAFGVGLPSQSYITSITPDVSYIYVTDDNLPNPYDTVPSYLGSLAGELDTGSTSTAPGAPTGLTATAASSSQINLSWTAPSNNGGSAITGYKIERSTAGTWSTIVSNTGSTGTTYSNTGLASSTAYSYRISAINAVGTSVPSNVASATTQAGSGGSSGIVLNNVQSTSGKTVSNQVIISNFNVGTLDNRLLVVGISANTRDVASITFGGVPLTKAVSSFYNNDAEFWYLKNPSGTANIVVTMSGATSVVAGAYSFSGVDQTNPIPVISSAHNTSASSPKISLTTTNPNDVVVDLPSIYGGVALGSPSCTQQWNIDMPNAITGASSSVTVSSPSAVSCSWTADGGDFWDDVAIEVKSLAAPIVTTHSIVQTQSGLVASDPLNNETKTQQELQSSQGYWKYNGDAPNENAPYEVFRDTSGLHVGVQAPSNGTYAGYFAVSPNTNAILLHSVITTPVRAVPYQFYNNGMYVQTANGLINYVTCVALTNNQATIWAIINTYGNTTQSTKFNLLWIDNSPNQPLTRDCTIITNGNNYLKVYLDGTNIYTNSSLNLQMPQPFNVYLEPETSYPGQMLVDTFTDYYVALDETIKVTNVPSNVSRVDIIDGSGNVLAISQITNGAATLDVGKYHFPLAANIKAYDSSNNMFASSGPVNIFGGSIYAIN